MRAFLIDEGVLLTEEDREFAAYACVYDKKYGYYDEGQCYEKDEKKAVEEARKYVEDGVESTYAIVSFTFLPDDFDFEEGCVEDEAYLLQDVLYSVAKLNGEIVEHFLEEKF